MRARLVCEKFTEKGDPIKDMGIGMFPKGFYPRYILKKQYPGMDLPVGTVFGKVEGWSSLVYYDKQNVQHGNTALTPEYFTPWVGEFFDET